MPGTVFSDVFVIGGGPAGLAAAIAARSRGFRVTLADCARPPIDKACGEGLMPDGVAALRELGVEIETAQSHPFRGIRFIESGASAEARFPAGTGLGIRRTVLHEAMAERAARAGVSLLWGRRVTGLGPDSVSLDGEIVRCRWIVGADGGRSHVRRWAGLDRGGHTVRYGFRRHYRIQPWSELVELYWADGLQVYVTPVRHDEMCVTAIAADSHLRLDQALAAVPGLSARLSPARPLNTERGAVTATRRFDTVWSGNVALVGDASGSVDAITGEGLCLAFREAAALAAALEAGDLSLYEAAHRRLRKQPAMMASFMLAICGRQGLRNRALRALSSRPDVFERMLELHVGAPSPLRSAAAGAALGWQMLIH